MKTFLFILFSFFLITNGFSQIQIKGRVLSVTNFEINKDGESILKKRTYPSEAFFHLSEQKFFVVGSFRSHVYELFDKDTATLNGQLTVSFFTSRNKKMYVIGIRELDGERDKLSLAIFSMSDPIKYTEYLLKISPEKNK
jgi:hypothetical protein